MKEQIQANIIFKAINKYSVSVVQIKQVYQRHKNKASKKTCSWKHVRFETC